MSLSVVFQQMLVILFLILTGVVLCRKSMLSDSASGQLSGIIVNVCNPALLISSAFAEGPRLSGSGLMLALAVSASTYAAVILCSYLIPALLRVPRREKYAWKLLTVYGNVGFIGIPLASAVLGSGSLIYVALHTLLYNILIYTHGISILRNAPADGGKTGAHPKSRDSVPGRLKETWMKFVNVGTLSAVLTVVLYLCDFPLPAFVTETVSSVGRATTFLSMLVLGVAVARMPLRELFTKGRLYLFTLLRMLVFPIACLLLMRLFIKDTMLIGVMALMLAVPAGNMPLMLSRQYGMDGSLISEGIILTTLLSLITIPVVTLFAV